jgi:3-phenylpropionate/trans-cinnamate dioxygenase ferredoxin subunit
MSDASTCSRLCRLTDLEKSGIAGAETGGRALVVVRTPQGVRVLRGLCPHQGALLSGGVLCGHSSAGQIGEYRYERQGEIVRCPWHGWEFDCETGSSLHDPNGTRIAFYESHICDGYVCLGSSCEPRPKGMEEPWDL